MNQNQTLANRIYLSIFSCLVLSSCVPDTILNDPYIVSDNRQKENIYYVPSAPNAPLLTKKNDIEFNVVNSSGSKYNGVDLQAAYLPSQHIGIIASYSSGGNNGGSPDYMKYNRFELGTGYIMNLPGGWHFETYAGAGNGKINNYHYSGFSKINLTHFFAQPAIAFTDEKNTITLGFVSRFSGVNFSVKDTMFQTDREPFSTAQLESLYKQPFHLMWEPGLIFRAGWKNFKFQAGYSFSSDLTNPDLHRSTSNLSLGVSLQFNTDDKKK